MSTKKRILINVGLMLCLFGLVALKLIIWHIRNIDMSWALTDFMRDPVEGSMLFVAAYGIFLSAFFALVTILLPSKAKAVFGMIALRISAAMGIVELCFYLMIRIVTLFGGYFAYINIDPLLTAGVIAVIYFAAATSDGFDISKTKKNENKSQWIFFSHKEKTISAKRKQGRLTSKIHAINFEKFGKRLFAASVAAVVVPAVSITAFTGTYTTVGRVLFACALIGVPCLFIGAAMLIFAHIRKQ